MTPELKDLRRRLDNLLDQWIRATPSEKAQLVLERIKLQEKIEAAEREAARSAG